ncbi:MAG: glycyl radical protein [Bacteroidetes bacterium]|jgi:trans-4-hydroxy-L-proline dehydratase|nr:glycyl radical protein [Bacteroidota bacterium]MBT6686427.1 glycyl radical protein [Bacteroidota bacterium]MBT7144666.1 glycyl radical protein [Bacteroidota bacterium]MBT7491299.1 glycyl radical protein [Bacteroidota bacterium]
MNKRINRLRKLSYEAEPSISIERALHQTDFYEKNYGKHSIPVLRALSFYDHCQKKTLYMGGGELIVGERGPFPKAVPTFPELTCHSVEDLYILNNRKQQKYSINQSAIDKYEKEVIPYWQGRTQRERIFEHVPQEWKRAYEAGLFTEFMEQRAPGHTALDGKIYKKGMNDFKKEIRSHINSLDYLNDPEATNKAEQLKAMDIACDAVILFAQRHSALAEKKSQTETNPNRKKELIKIAEVCRRVPANAARNFWEAVQMYWFVHLGTITELNGWDAMNPGHFDQHLTPFFEKEIAEGTLSRQNAKELICCLWIKVNNQPAPPKVGITAKESGTYNDFTNINLGGLKPDGSNAVSELSYIMLEATEELHLLQPGTSVHISTKTPNKFLHSAIKVIRKGYGYPSIFNTDTYIMEMLSMGKTLLDAREGGCSGCIEVGAFGKEAFLLTGYLNVPKILEITLNNGTDPLTGKFVTLETGNPNSFKTYHDLYNAFIKQLNFVIDQKIRVSNYIDKMFAKYAPAPFLSVVIDDCISKGKDYYNEGPRYNTNYIQCTGLGTITDSLSAIKKHVFEDNTFTMNQILSALAKNFESEEILRQRIINKTPFFGNDNNFADEIAVNLYNDLLKAIDGKPNVKGGKYHLNMLSTTCHIYFGKVLGATPNGRLAGKPISDGTSPSQGCDKFGPTAVIRSLSKLDQTRSGGTLLNLRFLPQLLKNDEDIEKLGKLIRAYFSLGGHHIQFNVVDTATLQKAQKLPDEYKDLLVRMAGYSDYFNDMNKDLQKEVISRTENQSF